MSEKKISYLSRTYDDYKKSFIEQVVKESSKKKILTREALDLLIDFFYRRLS